MYPETTSFYPAIVATSPKKVVGTDTIGVQVRIVTYLMIYIVVLLLALHGCMTTKRTMS